MDNRITIAKIIKRLHILLYLFLSWISYNNCKQGLKSGTPYIDIVLLFSGGKYLKTVLENRVPLKPVQGGVMGVAFSSIPMNRLNQTESAVFDSCMSSVISKDPFSDCGHLNVSGEDF